MAIPPTASSPASLSSTVPRCRAARIPRGRARARDRTKVAGTNCRVFGRRLKNRATVEVHVTLIPRPKVHCRIFRPLIGLGEKQAIGKLGVDTPAQFFQEGMRLRQIFTARP